MDQTLEHQYKSALRGARDTIRDLQRQTLAIREPVAIIGMSCLFPGGEQGDAETPDAFAELLAQGYDAVRPIPPERADLWRCKHSGERTPRTPALTCAALLKRDLFSFDRSLFGQTPAEASITDPQHRLLLELSWQAILDAGFNPASLAGTDTGVFAGKTGTEYLFDILGASRNAADDPYTMIGNMHSTLPGRISYVYDLHGPCVALDSACATGLVAVMAAVNSLRAGECSLALAGSVNLLLGPTPSHWLSAMQSLSADGRCKAFGAEADGFGRGEGGGMVVLERLSDAQRHRRRIHAVILGGAVGSDGKSAGFTAPNAKGQRLVMQRALANAGIEPGEVGFVETHGAGTPLGDPIEAESLNQVYGQRGPKLLIGSVKSNIAHLEAASGMAGLIKGILAVRDGVIPASLHCDRLNPLLDWKKLQLEAARQTQPWPQGYSRRVAGIDSFAISGTLAHLLVAEPPPLQGNGEQTQDALPCQVLTLSARSTQGLHVLASACATALEQGRSLEDLCVASSLRPAEPERLALAASNKTEALAALRAFAQGKVNRGLARGSVQGSPPQLCYLFSGQGSQHAGMGRLLYEIFPVFREIIDRCDEFAAPQLGHSLRAIMFAQNDHRLNHTNCTQPAIYAHQAALTALWLEYGVRPSAVFGHSIGEYAAAHAAGLFDLETGLAITLKRGALAASIPTQGAMAAILGRETVVAETIASCAGVDIAAVNGPDTVTIAGGKKDVEQAVHLLKQHGLESRPLPVSHAFHCTLIEPILDEFEEFLRTMSFAKPTAPIFSGLTGAQLDPDRDWPAYFRAQTRHPVRFMQALNAAKENVFLEIGASPTLTAYGRQCRENGIWLFSETADSGIMPFCQSLAKLYSLGSELRWGWQQRHQPRPEAMPPYYFERERLIPDWTMQTTAPHPDISPVPSSPLTAPDSASDAVHLAIRQCEVFREVCAMQQSLLENREHRRKR